MADASISIIAGTGQIIGQDIEATIKEVLHARTPDLRDMEVSNIQDRTPVRTGALQSSIDGIPYLDSGTDDLVFLFANDQPQLSEWGRVYAPYQEGPDLGLHTYTNPPRLMFASVLTDDIPQIEQWGIDACNEALNLCANGQGIPI
jgi:hypothetical protein